MKFVFLSDTHGKHDEITIPQADVFIFCGDMCSVGTLPEVESFARFLKGLPHKHKVVIAGNHDFPFENESKEVAEKMVRDAGAIYLNDSQTVIEGIKIWGSPIQPRFFDWAFNRDRGEEINKHWELIPEDTDVLITHGPPYGILDKIKNGNLVGCEELRKRVDLLKPKVHAFGHIHESSGIKEISGTTFVNASNLDFHYEYKNRPLTYDF